MDQHTTSERMSEALRQARQRWRRRLSEESREIELPHSQPAAWTIALSGEAGTAASHIARELAARLSWTAWDRELLEHIARDTGTRADLIESLDERPTSWLRECVDAWFQPSLPTGSGYVRHLVETILSLAGHGECIIVGRGAAMLLPARTTLAVRLVAPREDRIEAVQQRRAIAKAEAERLVDEKDEERREFVRRHFHRDPADPSHYDLVLNTVRLTHVQCVALILEALRQAQSDPGRRDLGITIGMCAVICGAQHFTEMEEAGKGAIGWRSSWTCPTASRPTTRSKGSLHG